MALPVSPFFTFFHPPGLPHRTGYPSERINAAMYSAWLMQTQAGFETSFLGLSGGGCGSAGVEALSIICPIGGALAPRAPWSMGVPVSFVLDNRGHQRPPPHLPPPKRGFRSKSTRPIQLFPELPADSSTGLPCGVCR